MTTFRLKRPNFSSFSLPISFFKQPFIFFLFFFFLTSSADILHAYLLLFKVKITNAVAFLLFAGFFLLRSFQVPRDFFFLFLAILGSMILSGLNSPNIISSVGFCFFFVFNFLFYFLISYNQFRFFTPERVLKIYSTSFYFVGLYAISQVIASLFGIHFPGVNQHIGTLARGMAFSYEPSYYALYMTPFTMYATTKFLLQDPADRKISQVFWPNLFLLISTSTGCFFSYLFLLFFIVAFRYFKLIQLGFGKLFFKFSAVCLFAISALWVTNKRLLEAGFLKFFFKQGISHFSVFDRWRGITEYWNIFLENPIIGVGFGGGPFYLAKKKGIDAADLLNPEILALYSPMNVTTEILASVGIIGGLCFILFFYLLVVIFIEAFRIPALKNEERISLISFAISLCVLFCTLQFNQSIMRAYMWIHVGIYCGYTRYLKEKYSLKLAI